MVSLRIPGMRTIKTSLAVAICLILFNLFDLEYSFYGAVAVIICIQNTVHGTFKVSKNRVIGTIIGSALGILFVYIFPYNPWISGIGVFLLIYLLKLIKLEDAYIVSSLVYLAIFIPGNGSAIIYGFERTTATILGILTALIVNLILSPPEYTKDIRQSSYNLIYKLPQYCSDFFIYDKDLNLSEVGFEIFNLEELIQIHKLDVKKIEFETIDIKNLENLLFYSKKIYNHLGVINELNKSGYKFNLNHKNIRHLNEIYDSKVVSIKNDEESSYDEVFNYHAEEVMKYLNKFKKLPVEKR